ncbi:MAG: hypothetical protein ACRELY_14015 [Polyangiaceae bacterium]
MSHFIRIAKGLGIGALALAAWIAPQNAKACGGDVDVVQPVISFPQQNAQTLLTAANDLESRARILDAQAANFTQRASEANIDARAIRVQASTSEDATERSQLLSLANQLASQAVTETSTASNLTRQAATLRQEARLDRVRAAQFNAGGGRWRGTPKTTARI